MGQDCPGCPKPKPAKRLKAAKRKAPPRRSWEQDSDYDGLDLPDEDFDYDEFVAKEFGTPHQRLQVKWYWWILGIIMLVLFSVGAYQVCWA